MAMGYEGFNPTYDPATTQGTGEGGASRLEDPAICPAILIRNRKQIGTNARYRW